MRWWKSAGSLGFAVWPTTWDCRLAVATAARAIKGWAGSPKRAVSYTARWLLAQLAYQAVRKDRLLREPDEVATISIDQIEVRKYVGGLIKSFEREVV
nr:hypothetical protein [Rubinisphaera italica]